MAGSRIYQEIADRNLSGTGAIVLMFTVAGNWPRSVQAVIFFGSDAKPLAAVAGMWTLDFDVLRSGASGWHYNQGTYELPGLQHLWIASPEIMLEPGDTLVVSAVSPSAGDTDVGVTANLYDVTIALPPAAAGGSGGLPTGNADNCVIGIAGTVKTLDALKLASDWQVIPGANYDGSTLRVAAALCHHGQVLGGASLSACTFQVYTAAGVAQGDVITGVKDATGYHFYGTQATEALQANQMYVLHVAFTYAGVSYPFRVPMPLNA